METGSIRKILLVATIALLAGCAPVRFDPVTGRWTRHPHRVSSAEASAPRLPPAAATVAVAPAAASSPAERGRDLFGHYCAKCHAGAEAFDKVRNRATFRAQIRKGSDKMPAFDVAKLSEGDVDALTAYVGAVRRSRVLARD